MGAQSNLIKFCFQLKFEEDSIRINADGFIQHSVYVFHVICLAESIGNPTPIPSKSMGDPSETSSESMENQIKHISESLNIFQTHIKKHFKSIKTPPSNPRISLFENCFKSCFDTEFRIYVKNIVYLYQ